MSLFEGKLKEGGNEVTNPFPSLALLTFGAVSALSAGCSDDRGVELPTNSAPTFLIDARNAFNANDPVQEVVQEYLAAHDFVVKKFGDGSYQDALIHAEIGNVLAEYDRPEAAIAELNTAEEILSSLQGEDPDTVLELRVRILNTVSEQLQKGGEGEKAREIKAKSLELQDRLYR